jgi:hypothetical protein
MRLLPTDLAHQFDVLLDSKGLDGQDKATYLKWLRFYWDFCHQYHYDAYRSERLPSFLDKLRKKRQSHPQRNQAWLAITWFYHLQPILAATSGVLARSENLATVIRNSDGALRSVVVPSNTKVENAPTSATCSSILAQRDSKRPSHPDGYTQ